MSNVSKKLLLKVHKKTVILDNIAVENSKKHFNKYLSVFKWPITNTVLPKYVNNIVLCYLGTKLEKKVMLLWKVFLVYHNIKCRLKWFSGMMFVNQLSRIILLLFTSLCKIIAQFFLYSAVDKKITLNNWDFYMCSYDYVGYYTRSTEILCVWTNSHFTSLFFYY